jgi:cyclase
VFAEAYYRQGIDEIIYMDVVASLYGRNTIIDLVRHTAADVFIPMTVGGGVRSVEDARALLRAGADKVAVNTAAIRNPGFITEIARKYGSQCCVLSIEAQRHGPGQWEAYCDGGREHTGLDVIEWAERGQQLGAGEILLTCINNEGVKVGFDVPLVRAVRDRVTIPIIASGGMGQFAHLVEVTQQGGADAVVMAYVLHYGLMTVPEIRQRALAAGLDLREAA